jgi:hypothetical protein
MLNNTNNTNAPDEDLNADTNVETLLKLIKDQTKEIKINKRRLEKLEEKYVKINTDLKNVLNDKNNIENFLRTIFPKEIQDTIIKTEYGLYDTNELSKMWIVVESKNQNEFHKILNQMKNENADYQEKIKVFKSELEQKTNELKTIKSTYNTNVEQLSFYSGTYNDIVKKNEELENEKVYLMRVLDEKNKEIENLIALEIENAELRAKSLLEEKNDNNMDNINLSKDKKHSYMEEKVQEKSIKICKYLILIYSIFKRWLSDYSGNIYGRVCDWFNGSNKRL